MVIMDTHSTTSECVLVKRDDVPMSFSGKEFQLSEWEFMKPMSQSDVKQSQPRQLESTFDSQSLSLISRLAKKWVLLLQCVWHSLDVVLSASYWVLSSYNCD